MAVRDADVGYRFIDGFGCDVNYVWQLVLNFDLNWLKSVESKLLGRAELSVGESVVGAANNDGKPITSATCLGRLTLAPAVITPGQLLDGEEMARLDDDAGQSRTWNVHGKVNEAIIRGNPPLAGFVLHAANENLDAESEASCASTIFTVLLKLDYLVLK
jgi:hypothetical protein